MTTFNDMNSMTSAKDISTALALELTGNYCVRGKEIDVSTENGEKMLGRIDWIINRIGRALDIKGKLDPNNTSFRIDRDKDNIIHVRFVDIAGQTLYTLDFGDKSSMMNGGEFEYILRDSTGNEITRGHRWTVITTFFAPSVKETVVKEAASPKNKNKNSKEIEAGNN